MPLEDEIHARLRELTREVRKVREGLKQQLRSSRRHSGPATADERLRGAEAPAPPPGDPAPPPGDPDDGQS
jgi:hypothetical protein